MKRLFTNGKPEISQFHDKNGDLTVYSFACGYVEKYEKGENRLTISKEPNDWHVKGFLDEMHVWESFEKLKDARKFCKKA
jgi:hypothetical protein